VDNLVVVVLVVVLLLLLLLLPRVQPRRKTRRRRPLPVRCTTRTLAGTARTTRTAALVSAAPIAAGPVWARVAVLLPPATVPTRVVVVLVVLTP
jgi:hypothetical protein